MGYKELQDLIKAVLLKAALDREYRELCLTDSRAAICKLAVKDVEALGCIIFRDEDTVCPAKEGYVCVLPPYIKKSWLLSGNAKTEGVKESCPSH